MIIASCLRFADILTMGADASEKSLGGGEMLES
jgi:hypothetical protein